MSPSTRHFPPQTWSVDTAPIFSSPTAQLLEAGILGALTFQLVLLLNSSVSETFITRQGLQPPVGDLQSPDRDL